MLNLLDKLRVFVYRKSLKEQFYISCKSKKYGKFIQAGDFSYGNPIVFNWTGKYKVIIGKYCSFADPKFFLDGNHRTDWVTTYPFPELEKYDKVWSGMKKIIGHQVGKGDIVVGNDVWIGHGAVIMSGVHIADGAVVAAMAVVTKNVEPYSIVAGNPAICIKKRFSEDTINKLLQIRWWDWSVEKVKENIELLCDANIENFINKNIK